MVQQSKENKQARAIVSRRKKKLLASKYMLNIYISSNRLKKNVPTVVTTKWNIIPCNYVPQMKVKLSFTTVKNAGKFLCFIYCVQVMANNDYFYTVVTNTLSTIRFLYISTSCKFCISSFLFFFNPILELKTQKYIYILWMVYVIIVEIY